MYELRWILLVAGALLIAGLWIWEWYRTRAAARHGQGGGLQERIEPRMADVDGESVEPAPADVPTIRATATDRVAPPLNPPVVEIPAGVEPELSRAPTLRGDDTLAGTLPVVDPAIVQAEQRQPWVRTQPIEVSRNQARKPPEVDQESAPVPPRTARSTPPPPEPESRGNSRQRIVALRLISMAERWTGRQLFDALEAEGLRFGRYSIYHFQRDDGKTIFYVASLVEPGSFDQERLDEADFPGVSLFAVLPGPLDAPTAFDQMLATARRLADRLQGQLQDEHGSSLTAQRVLNLREELVHFEHLSVRARQR